jgi:general secretion pathway protein I
MARATTSRRRPPAPRGAPIFGAFTLLEVMVAVTILGIALTAIFSSEAGAIRVAGRARHLTTATLLARCKMGEIEEQVLREGLPAVSANGVDECCETGEVDGFECEWEIMRIVLPDAIPAGGDGGDGNPLGLLGGAGEASATAPPSAPTPDQMMSGAMMSGGGDMVSQMALQFVFPILKPQLEEQVRRARVTVRWHEGTNEQEVSVSQYLVAEQPPILATEAAIQSLTGPTAPRTPAPPGTAPVTPVPQR